MSAEPRGVTTPERFQDIDAPVPDEILPTAPTPSQPIAERTSTVSAAREAFSSEIFGPEKQLSPCSMRVNGSAREVIYLEQGHHPRLTHITPPDSPQRVHDRVHSKFMAVHDM